MSGHQRPHMRLNTDKEYPCLHCGTLGNIVRESEDLEQRRVKCNAPRCGFTYSAADSLRAKEKGQIPNEPLVSQPETSDDDQVVPEELPEARPEPNRQEVQKAASTSKAPRTPSFVILSKDRLTSEFCTKKNLRERVIVWTAQEKKFDVFELTPKKVQAKLSIQ